jgi:hypothetical protein
MVPCILLLVSLPPLTWAEVGVALDSAGGGSRTRGLYILASITDDPGPISTAWIRYNSNDGAPSIQFNTFSGLPIVAWARNSPGGYDVVISTFSGGAWTPAQVVAGSAADELDPFLVMDPGDGSVHLLYWEHGAQIRVMHRTAPADLSSWSDPVQVSQPGEPAVRPAAAFHDGDLNIVYEVHALGYGSTPREIVRATENGESYTSEVVATTFHMGENWPQVHSGAGRIWVDWIDTEGEMSWTRQLVPGPWGQILIEPYTNVEERDFHVRGAIKSLAMQ